MSNGTPKGRAEDALNPLKRRNLDTGIDYPRRRATIAVRHEGMSGSATMDTNNHLSAKSAALESLDAMETSRNASCVLS